MNIQQMKCDIDRDLILYRNKKNDLKQRPVMFFL